MTFLLVYLAILILPGALLSVVLGLQMQRTTLSIALSITVFVAALLVARLSELPAGGFYVLLSISYALLVAGGLWRLRRGRHKLDLPAFSSGVFLIPVGTLAGVAIYTGWAGPYTEIPADVWWHIGRINHHLNDFAAGSIGSFDGVDEIIDKYAGYGYMLPAFVLEVTGGTVQASLSHLAFANVLLFTTAVYSFTLLVFKDFALTSPSRHAVAALTVFFFFTHFGISVFSYVRYYAFAPGMLNFIVYLGAAACFIHFTRLEHGGFRYLLVTISLLATALLVHMQEALFILVMAATILLAEAFLRWRNADIDAGQQRKNLRTPVLLGIFFVGYAAGHVLTHMMVPRNDPLAHGVMASISHYLPFLANLYILRPTLQFYQVLTIWGVFIYLSFVLYRKQLGRSPFLLGGMALPFLTVFNPVFTDFFLRMAPPEVLWRLCFLLPLPFVAAYVFVDSIRKVTRETRWPRRLTALSTSLVLLGLLLPFETTYVFSSYSRIYTLAPVSNRNDHRLWKDLIEELNTLDPGNLITDPVTGYVLNALTDHNYNGYKFYGFGAMKVDRSRYGDSDFNGKEGWLVVINKRDGAASQVGRLSGHWPEAVLKVSDSYSEAFESYVTSRPDRFRKIWERDGAAIYEITDIRNQDQISTLPVTETKRPLFHRRVSRKSLSLHSLRKKGKPETMKQRSGMAWGKPVVGHA